MIATIRRRLKNLWERLSLAQQFMLASLVVLACTMTGVGWWVSQEIQAGVTQHTAATTALYVDSFVAPLVQELGDDARLQPQHVTDLDRLVRETPLGQQIVSFKIWNAEGRIVYSANPAIIGRIYPMGRGLTGAWQGSVTSHISGLEDEEHAAERPFGDRLLETYSPVRLKGSNRVIAVAEFYQTVDRLEGQLLTVQMYSWLVVGVAALVMFILLAGIARRGSNTIVHQQRELQDKVGELSRLLAQNKELGERVRRAATRTTAHNERFLRRISAELHDGPAQALSLALLRLDAVIAHAAGCGCEQPTLPQANEDLDVIQNSVGEALEEMRTLAAGLALPELEDLALPETLARVVRVHEQRTATKVTLGLDSVPQHAPLAVKITVYRLVQEALFNAYRHGGGLGQQVQVKHEADQIKVEVSDQGPGFDHARGTGRDQHLGLNGMRERVESLGGTFRIDGGPGSGTILIAWLPLQPLAGDRDG